MKFRKKPVVIEATQWFKHGDHPKVTIMPRGREACAEVCDDVGDFMLSEDYATAIRARGHDAP